MSEPLPALLDCAAVARELGIKRAAAERVMTNLPKVQVPGLRKVYVRRKDVRKLIEENTKAA